jgi:hypothetical protein
MFIPADLLKSKEGENNLITFEIWGSLSPLPLIPTPLGEWGPRVPLSPFPIFLNIDILLLEIDQANILVQQCYFPLLLLIFKLI